jgi:hypothetical protein
MIVVAGGILLDLGVLTAKHGEKLVRHALRKEWLSKPAPGGSPAQKE